jgi:hypothetical protein
MDTRAIQVAAITRGQELIDDLDKRRINQAKFLTEMFTKVSIWYAEELKNSSMIMQYDPQWIRDWASFVFTDEKWKLPPSEERDEYFLRVANRFFKAFHTEYNVITPIDELFPDKTREELKVEAIEYIKRHPEEYPSR